MAGTVAAGRPGLRLPTLVFVLIAALCSAARGEEIAPSAPVSTQFLFTRALIRGYQVAWAPARGTVCLMEPHCSHYALEAFAHHGAVSASLMTFDRLLRCGADRAQYQVARVGNSYRLLDVDAPDFGVSSYEVLGGEDRPALTWVGDTTGHPGETAWRPDSLDTGDDHRLHAFARSLQAAGDYDRAITEYLRVNSYYPASPYARDARQSATLCFYLAKRYEEAAAWGRRFLDAGPTREDANDLTLLIGLSQLRAGRPGDARGTFNRVDRSNTGGNFGAAAKAPLLEALSAAHARQWAAAESLFAAVPADSPYGPQALHCRQLCADWQTLRLKSPRTAGILGAVPGLGYLYDGYPRTALSALVINGLFALGTVEAIHNGNDGLAAAAGILGLGWYAGSVYGSVASAHRANQKREADWLLKCDVGFQF